MGGSQGVLLVVAVESLLALNLGIVICARLSLHISRLGLPDQREIAPVVYSLFASLYSSRLGLSDQHEIAPVVYSLLAFLYTACESVHQISCASCVQLARLSIQLATRSINCAIDCAS